ncbi:pleckstrin homology domain-containing family A member 2 [Gadus macrocephalus]|uniref:pleckstrin homology domain-containing family A member 2 n=1 Tax=Gadus macrocephalus TaxID=80720 RepID=UPI0028CB34BF|nr:pleckstrin homology domain-containing family A member 2 [Gadus macrocephalus]XP_059921658.1 pleckstrin homology domain-containing family A member 2 [Gadus macrocephalus]XP_059921659.1 pleckstrin homology domain-containing family A member 2 [Gadus macrocephalus]XP_059921660.1 pleckstrin homology domain-containing family A member 2 [Gadus macrocephalus]
MPYVDRLNRVCGFLDLEEKENSSRFLRRYFILDTQSNVLLWYMDNPQNLPSGACSVGSLKLTYISKVNEASLKQKPKTEFCFVINAVSRRYFLQANDAVDMKDWVVALNQASKITVPKGGLLPLGSEVSAVVRDPHAGKRQQAYKTEIIGGVVVHTPIQNEGEEGDGRRGNRPGVLRCGYCVKQGNVRKSWKRRFFTLDDSAVSYYKCETDKEPLRAIQLRDVQKVHECLVKSGDLLLRDNLFEIITSSRVFYVQTDSPEEMRGWIRDIEGKILGFRGPAQGPPFQRGSSLYRSAQGPPPVDWRPQLMKSCSVAPGWQPWTPLPKRGAPALDPDEGPGPFGPLTVGPSLSSSSNSSSSSSSNSLSAAPPPPGPADAPPAPPEGGVFSRAWSSGRRRHRSQPSAGHAFPFSLDEDGIRTTDV